MALNSWNSCVAQLQLYSYNHHINSPRAGPSRPPRINPIRQPATAAAQNPSSLSITPPWPGMSRLESFAPNCLFTQDSNKSPNCAKTESTNVIASIATVLNDPIRLATSSPTIMAPAVPAIAPDQVFFGLTTGINFGPPKARPAK